MTIHPAHHPNGEDGACGHTHKNRHNHCQRQDAVAQCCGRAQDYGEDAEEPASARTGERCIHGVERAKCEICGLREDDGCDCGHGHGETEREEQKREGVRLGAAALLFGAGLIWNETPAGTLLFAASYLVAGLPVLISAAKNLFSRRMFDETLLMAIATIGAAALGDFAEAAAVMILFGAGELLQDHAVGSSKRSISALLSLKADSAHVLRGGAPVTVDPAEVAVGEQIVVKPYERLPLDGVVTQGESYIDASALTGESVPVRAHAGDAVLAGGVNGEGALTVEVTARYADSAVSKIIRMTEQAAKQKSPREKFITRFARVYTPAVVGLAALVAVVPPLAGFGSFSQWIYTALTFLVISCPCALVISVPLAFFAGLGGASKAGILLRGATGIEALAKTGAVAMDKTGTLTRGQFAVTGVEPADGVTKQRLLALCAGAEALSTHPIARALTEASPQAVQAADITEIRGRGVKAAVDGKILLVGSGALLAENSVSAPAVEPGGTVVMAALDGLYIGRVTLGDTLKDDAADTVAALKQMGVRTVLLTGDSAGAARVVARQVGVDEVYAGLLPGDKVEHIEALKKSVDGTTVFVGDGINDAPVIAAADVGVSMGGLGSDAAIEASDVVLMTDEPGKLVTAIRHSKRTLRIVSQNIALALGVKGLMLVLGLFGISSMWLAIVADVGTALLAVLNSVRALRVQGRLI